MRTTSGMIALFLLLGFLGGCGDLEPLDLTFDSKPTLRMNPNGNAPLSGWLQFNTHEDQRATLVISDGNTTESRVFGGYRNQHGYLLLGLKPNRRYTIRIQLENRDGVTTEAGDAIGLTTPPLPADFPAFEVTSDPQRMEPGVTMFSPYIPLSDAGGYIVAVDTIGDVVWFVRIDRRVTEIDRRANGNLLLVMGHGVAEMDMLGRIVNRWTPIAEHAETGEGIAVNVANIHHDVIEAFENHFWVISAESRHFDAYPTSETDPQAPWEPRNVVGDLVVEFSTTGQVTDSWSLFDILDPYRFGYDGLSPFANTSTDLDWSHANAVVYDPDDDAMLVSIRHQDAIVKIDRQSGELIWIMGPHENWSDAFAPFLFDPTDSATEWFYHPHAPQLLPNGNILLFDNGNHRASPFDPKLPPGQNYSRAVEYAVDTDAMQITQVWEYGKAVADRLYTPFLGDADLLPQTGNVLVTFGGSDISRIVEVTRKTAAQVVFELRLVHPDPTAARVIYRSDRYPDLYP